MADFWFVSAPLPGHLDWGGLLRTAQALAQAGHRVSWLSGKQVARMVTRAGLDFIPLRQTGWLWPPPPLPDVSRLPPQEAVMLRYRRALDTWLSVEPVRAAAAELIALGQTAGAPDMIVTDPFISAAALAAEALDAPLAVGGWPALAELDEERLLGVQKTLGADSRARLRRLLDCFNLQGRNFSRGAAPSVQSPLLHLCFFTEDWYAEERGGLVPQNAFLGGAPSAPDDDAPDWLNAIPADAPLALITLGTAFTGDLGFFSWAAQAAARLDLIPIVVIGWTPLAPERKAELLAALPRRARLLNWVDFHHVLPRARLAIHHGGMGTTHAVVVHGVPQLVVPHAADQRAQARRVAQAKVGLNLSAHDVRQGALFSGARALLNDDKVQQRARDLATEMAACGGPQRAARLLAETLARHRSESAGLP